MKNIVIEKWYDKTATTATKSFNKKIEEARAVVSRSRNAWQKLLEADSGATAVQLATESRAALFDATKSEIALWKEFPPIKEAIGASCAAERARLSKELDDERKTREAAMQAAGIVARRGSLAASAVHTEREISLEKQLSGLRFFEMHNLPARTEVDARLAELNEQLVEICKKMVL